MHFLATAGVVTAACLAGATPLICPPSLVLPTSLLVGSDDGLYLLLLDQVIILQLNLLVSVLASGSY